MMYAIIERDTGRIVQFVDTDEHTAKLNTPPECFYKEFNGDAGEPVYYLNGGFAPMGESPSINHDFDYRLRRYIDRRTPAEKMREVRQQRNKLLQASDWTQLPDVPEGVKQPYAEYRQKLRDITRQPANNVVFPKPPKV